MIPDSLCFHFRLQFGGTLENIGVSGIGTVGDGIGMSKDDPMQLSDILPKTLMYDKMRPPKVEGDVKNTCRGYQNCFWH